MTGKGQRTRDISGIGEAARLVSGVPQVGIAGFLRSVADVRRALAGVTLAIWREV